MHPRTYLSILLWAAASAVHAQAMLTLADQPVRLIRGASVYKAFNGSAIQKDDIIETGAAGVQIEAGKQTIVALGPQTRVFVLAIAGDDKSSTELALMQGWVKLAASSAKGAQIVTPALRANLPSGAIIVQAKAGREALFVEEGAPQVAKVDEKGKPGTPLKLAAEQFAYADPAKPQPQVGRPSRDYLAEMPRAFRDRLVQAPPAPKAGKVAPLKEREVAWEDVNAWMLSTLPVRRGFVNRFKVRLSDEAFRAQVEQAFGQSAEWRFVLHPATTVGNVIH